MHHIESFPLILGSDLIYVEAVIEILMETLRVLLRKPDGIFWMAHCTRKQGNRVTIEKVLDAAQTAGLEHRILSTDGDLSLMQFRWRP